MASIAINSRLRWMANIPRPVVVFLRRKLRLGEKHSNHSHVHTSNDNNPWHSMDDVGNETQKKT